MRFMASIFEPYRNWILEHKDDYDNAEDFITAIQEMSGLSFGYSAIRSYFHRQLGMPFNFEHAIRFSNEEKDFIIKYFPENGPTKTAEMIHDLFGIDRLPTTVGAMAYKMGCRMNDNALYIDKVRRVRVCHKARSKDIGCIRTEIDKNGHVCTRIKTEKGWVSGAKAIWEQHYGPIPKGYQVIYLDNNSQNLDINNLYLVSYKVKYQVICSDHYKTGDPELTKTLIKFYELRNALGMDAVDFANLMRKFNKALEIEGE